MTFSQASNLLAFPDVLPGKYQVSAQQALEQMRPSHAEISQQLRNQLQTSLEVSELLGMFFSTSQQLVNYQGLSYHNPAQLLRFKLGTHSGAFRIDYHLELEGESLGTLSLYNTDTLAEHALVSLESLTPLLAFPLRNALKYHAVLHASLHDPLTGVRNRASMAELLERDLHSAHRMGTRLSVLMLDIDHFKSINDLHGHAGGDAVLIAVAHLLQDKLRNVDAIFRYGGEEFLIVLPNTGEPQVMLVAERLRQRIADMVVVHASKRINISVSFGAAVAKLNERQQTLLERADTALYAAKNSGRNRVCLAK